MGCTWCTTHWECDGEGGSSCSPTEKGGGPPACRPGPPPHWEIHDRVRLRYENGDPVEGEHGDVMVQVDTRHPGIQITLNTRPVPSGNDGQGPAGKRPWLLDRMVPLLDPSGKPVSDRNHKPVIVRVQSYIYDKDANHPHEACDGRGPKVCLYAVNWTAS